VSDTRLRFFGAHARVFHDEARELDVEGAVRAGKTWLCLTKILHACVSHPGMHWMIARWSDGDTTEQLKPTFVQLCDIAGLRVEWHADERYYKFANGSLVYVMGLFSQDQARRYAKMRGKTLAGVYVDQAEEIPEPDIYDELVVRLSQPGYPRQIILSPQTVRGDHWIADYFPDTPDRQRPGTSYYALSTFDNAHNLDAGWIADQETRMPPGTPQHTTLLLGRRGAVVIGDPVYGGAKSGPGAFVRSRHEVACAYDPRLALEIALDFGRHHPCAVCRQVSALGQVRYLGGLLGLDLGLSSFLDVVLRYVNVWFPAPIEVRWCGDPAALSNPIGVDMPSLLREHGIHARFIAESNSPLIRLATIERTMKLMRERDLAGNEAFLVARDDRWVQVSAHGVTQFRFLADALEFGYVWDKHTVSVANKPVRRPLKDGWYDHGMNCLEYLEANFGARQSRQPDPDTGPKVQPYRGHMSWAG
jgi:hypothetical protein